MRQQQNINLFHFASFLMTTISKSYQLSARLMMIVYDCFWSFMIVYDRFDDALKRIKNTKQRINLSW